MAPQDRGRLPAMGTGRGDRPWQPAGVQPIHAVGERRCSACAAAFVELRFGLLGRWAWVRVRWCGGGGTGHRAVTPAAWQSAR